MRPKLLRDHHISSAHVAQMPCVTSVLALLLTYTSISTHEPSAPRIFLHHAQIGRSPSRRSIVAQARWRRRSIPGRWRAAHALDDLEGGVARDGSDDEGEEDQSRIVGPLDQRGRVEVDAGESPEVHVRLRGDRFGGNVSKVGRVERKAPSVPPCNGAQEPDWPPGVRERESPRCRARAEAKARDLPSMWCSSLRSLSPSPSSRA